MPIPSSVARFNRVATNHVTRPLAARMPGFAVVHHQGRKSGKNYRTPVNLFRRPGGYLIALTYGSGDWVKNVVAAGGCEIETGGKRLRAQEPHIVHDETRRHMPPGVRHLLQLMNVTDFLYLTPYVPGPLTEEPATAS